MIEDKNKKTAANISLLIQMRWSIKNWEFRYLINSTIVEPIREGADSMDTDQETKKDSQRTSVAWRYV